MQQVPKIFDRNLLRLRLDRASKNFSAHDFLFVEVAKRLVERLSDIKRSFDVVVNLEDGFSVLNKMVQDRNDIKNVQQVEISKDEVLSLEAESLDLVISSLGLHWINDLPGVLVQIRRTLKPDGLFLGALFGSETLQELRDVLMQAELEIEGGVSPRISPFVDVRDAGGLLQRAGFALPVADSDTFVATYSNAWELMRDLRGMGQSNILMERRKSFTRRATFLRAAELYTEKYALSDGRIPATFQIVYLTGWRPHESQQKPLKPGSGKRSLVDTLK